MADGFIGRCDLTDYNDYNKKIIKSSVFGSGSSSLLEYYKKLYDESRSNSAINVYNKMIEDAWFSYIDGTDYKTKPAKISYIALDPEIGFLSPSEAVATNTAVSDMNYGYVAKMLYDLRKQSSVDRYGVAKNGCTLVEMDILERTQAALTPDQINRLMQHIADNPAFGTDKKDLSFIQVLDDLGFSFEAYNAYIESLPKSGIGTIYRDPDLPKEQTDGKYKVMPVSIEHHYDEEKGSWTSKGWYGTFAKGYALQESANNADAPSTTEMVRMCYNSEIKGDTVGDFYDDKIMLLHFEKADSSSLIGSFFSNMSAATVPIICIGAAAIIAVPTVILVSRKKKAAESSAN